MIAQHCCDHVYRNKGNLPLLDMIPNKTGGRALDCGCGAGDSARIMLSRGWKVDGVTISEAERSIASAHCEKVYLFDLNHGVPPDLGSGYDVVLMSHVLEHLITPDRLLQDAKKVLDFNGVVAVALPNVLYYRQRVKFLLGSFEYEEEGIMDQSHVRFYTFTSGARLLSQNGYSILTAGVHGNLPLWKLRKIIPGAVERSFNRLACAVSPNLFGSQSLYIVAPTEKTGT